MKNFFAPGENIEFTTSGDVVSGDVIIAGNLVGIAANSTVGASQVNVMCIKGIFKVAKRAEALTLGQKLYWNTTTKNLSNTITADTFMGYAASAALSGDATVNILLARPGS